MSWFAKVFALFAKRSKKDANQRAAEIKAKYQAKRQVQGLFTPAQEELMDELGLTPGKVSDLNKKEVKEERANNKNNKKARNPLTARQRKLAKELGLLKED